MYEVKCHRCREVNQLNDRKKNTTVRCNICKKVIQVGQIKEEIIENINILDDHEERIIGLEKQDNKPIVYNNPISTQVFTFIDFCCNLLVIIIMVLAFIGAGYLISLL